MEQKIIRVGNSLAVTLPSAFVKDKKVKAGQRVIFDAEAGLDLVNTKSKKQPLTSLTPGFMDMIDGVNKRYGQALKELARR